MAEEKKLILRGDNDWGIWLKKWAAAIIVPAASVILISTSEYITNNPLPIDPKWAFLTGLIVTIMYQIGNLIKHA
jgi:hypothetical protein